MTWDVRYEDGVRLPQAGWWLDARHPVDRSFVSHAHFDHLADHDEIVCTPATAKLMATRMPVRGRVRELPFGTTEALGAEVALTLFPAGHIFGSALALLEHAAHGRLLYTGDFKLRPGRSAEPCAPPRAGVLIMETTYGRPQYVLPPTAEVLDAIARFCLQALDDGETPILFGYSLGKSQELLGGLAGARLPVMLHPQTHRLTRVYEELGVAFPPYRAFAAEELAGHVLICPPQAAGSAFVRRISPRRTAVVTGWALDAGARFRYQCDAAFPLSDHADFPDLIRLVDLVQPNRVLTLHGFAADFARTLRGRGVEAWSLTEEDQLELALPVSDSGRPVPTAAPFPTPVSPPRAPVPPASGPEATEPAGQDAAPEAGAPPDSFRHFGATAEAIGATPRKLEKVALLAAYLRALSADDAGRAAVFFTGNPFPKSDARTVNVGPALVRRALLEATAASPDDYRRTYLRFHEGGETVEALVAAAHRDPESGRPDGRGQSLAEVERLLGDLAAARGPQAKLDLLEAAFRSLAPAEAKYLVKIMSGDLRIGLKEGLVEEAIAAAAGQPLEQVKEAHMLSGDMAATASAARRGTLSDVAARLFQPLHFMLASPEPTAEAIVGRLGAEIWIEDKYDGIRCQLHRGPGRVELYSRDLRRITDQFPDLERAARSLGREVIVDGELLAWRDGRALPFADLQKRLGRKGDDFFLGAEVPVSMSCYDLLWLDGRSLIKAPLAERRIALEAALAGQAPGSGARFVPAPVRRLHSAAEIDAAFLAARARGNEGLMAKDPASPYTPGRRGLAWLKLKKAFATLDVVVVAVEYGHGKRRGVLSDYTFAVRDETAGRLLTVGKAYSGLTDAEIAQLTAHFLERTTEVRGRRLSVVPDTVLEVAFDSIQPSERHSSGFALRFPRILRIRTDKGPADIDTLETCRRLAGIALEGRPSSFRSKK